MKLKMSESIEVMWTTVLSAAIIGWLLGVGQLIIMDAWHSAHWVMMPMMPLYSMGGWALYGMILGGSGVFIKKTQPQSEPAKSRTARAA
jgi:hypothetical protein